MNKKLAILLIALILALVAAYFIYKPDFGRNNQRAAAPERRVVQEKVIKDSVSEGTPEVKAEENEESAEPEEEDVSEQKQAVERTAPKPVKKVLPSAKTSQQPEKTIVKELKVEETHQIDMIEDDMDWSLLEKIPRSDIVIVDRVYKVKSPRRYFFK